MARLSTPPRKANLSPNRSLHLVLDAGAPPDLRILKILWVDPIPTRTLDRAWPDGFPGWALEHAAHLETSMMLALRPDLVRREEIREDGVESLPPYDVYPQAPDFVPVSGVLSDPSRGTAEAGELLLAAAVDGLVAVIERELGAVSSAARSPDPKQRDETRGGV